MFDCLDKKATQSGFARLVGVSKQAISARVAEGQLVEGGTYSEWLASYLDRLRHEAAGRSEKELAETRARKELVQAKREELGYAKDLDLIVMVEDVGPGLCEIMKEVVSVVLGAGNKILQSVETTHDIQLDDDIVLSPLRSGLRSVAASADQFVATVSRKPSRAVSSAVAADAGVDRGAPKTTG